MTRAVIVSAVRTAVARGKRDGSLATVHPVDLSAIVLSESVRRARIEPGDIDDVLWGCAMPEASQGLNISRLAVLRAGLPVEVPAATINRFCASGLQTVASAAQSIMSGMTKTVVAGGVEMMSQVPMSGYHTRLHPGMTADMIGMGFTAERVAEQWKVSRHEQDEYALGSHQKAAAAVAAGAFDGQIVPVAVNGSFGKDAPEDRPPFAKDELVRADTSLERLAALRPAFRAGGSVTAGNSSPFSDGAAALVLMSEDEASSRGLEVLASVLSFAAAGVEPDVMGIGPVRAVPKALKLAGLALSEIDLIEFNEAFASQAIAVARELGFPPEKVNVNGGAIALGHPLGATGAKLATQLVHELRRRGGGHGLVTMCIGGGMGAAGVIRVD